MFSSDIAGSQYRANEDRRSLAEVARMACVGCRYLRFYASALNGCEWAAACVRVAWPNGLVPQSTSVE
jgi:hypothetical protein